MINPVVSFGVDDIVSIISNGGFPMYAGGMKGVGLPAIDIEKCKVLFDQLFKKKTKEELVTIYTEYLDICANNNISLGKATVALSNSAKTAGANDILNVMKWVGDMVKLAMDADATTASNGVDSSKKKEERNDKKPAKSQKNETNANKSENNKPVQEVPEQPMHQEAVSAAHAIGVPNVGAMMQPPEVQQGSTPRQLLGSVIPDASAQSVYPANASPMPPTPPRGKYQPVINGKLAEHYMNDPMQGADDAQRVAFIKKRIELLPERKELSFTNINCLIGMLNSSWLAKSFDRYGIKEGTKLVEIPLRDQFKEEYNMLFKIERKGKKDIIIAFNNEPEWRQSGNSGQYVNKRKVIVDG